MKNIWLANTKFRSDDKDVTGEIVILNNEKYYKIANYDQMPDFFMAIVSDSDLWMYISSTGSLTAGRKDRDNALFPYYTEDKIHDYRDRTGSKTSCLVHKEGKLLLWEPFARDHDRLYNIERNLYKSFYGTSVIFEEINHDLGLSFRYGWYSSGKYGWIKRSHIETSGSTVTRVQILDGIRNILPYGVDYAFQNEYSNLLLAYRKNELLPESKMALYLLSSIPVDNAEPSEALKANVVWSAGTGSDTQYLISDRQLESFRRGEKTETETDLFASAGAYYTVTSHELESGKPGEWYFAADVCKDSTAVVNLDCFLRGNARPEHELQQDIAEGTLNLIRIVAAADGIQLTRDELMNARHFTNTLYNVMRGGIFENNYSVNADDFRHFVRQCNTRVSEKHARCLASLPALMTRDWLTGRLREEGDHDLDRICLEYLPLTFSRRHGDPSRPWNRFSIEPRSADGSRKTGYQGNWRDIFQNWEALCLSFPGYIESVIARFVNASTADGYNPYRISREGIDWERPMPDDPWAYIGYWGDHQLIYLQKFLEQSCRYNPGLLDTMLADEVFVYANIPYRIRPIEEILANPKDTIIFDWKLNAEIDSLKGKTGSDGALLRTAGGEIYRVNLMEKILCSLLSKISNFIPGAGIWLNTQRPEWNDANNALVGNGASVVTLCYLRRSLRFWISRLENHEAAGYSISEELFAFLDRITTIFRSYGNLPEGGFTDSDRYDLALKLGKAGSDYRETIYEKSFSGKRVFAGTGTLLDFLKISVAFADHTIKENLRGDGLFHSYNLISFRDKGIAVRRLYLMLEGQVAALSSGFPDGAMSLRMLESMKSSALYREDQQSYMLYPFRKLPRFTEKNNLTSEQTESSGLLRKMIDANDSSIVSADAKGNIHFNGAFRNASMLSKALGEIDGNLYGTVSEQEKNRIIDIYESVFDHQSFTGRSGTFYGYEGLGSIYWHMVSKLLLAVYEAYEAAKSEGVDQVVSGKILEHYYLIKEGLGIHKSPALHGAFPVDAYSHTPAGAGARQPGLTGQVKEDIVSRFSELGLTVQDGIISLVPSMLRAEEQLAGETDFVYFDTEGRQDKIKLTTGQIAFTLCQVPVVYSPGETDKTSVCFANGEISVINGCLIDATTSKKIFERNGEIRRIEITTNIFNII